MKRTEAVFWFAVVSAILALLSFFIFPMLPEGPVTEGIERCIVGFWIFVPPLWLWYEYCFLYPDDPNLSPLERFERFKYGQELTRNLWLAVTAVLVLLYFKKVPGL